jgi:threonine/homoserine/homoserine lactone efflux protein
MLRALVAFAPVAALLIVTPGAATALVVRSAATGGRRQALATTVGNSLGVLAWGCFAAMGVAAVVATSAEAFTAIKLVGAVVLVVLGLQSLRGHREDPARRRPRAAHRCATASSRVWPIPSSRSSSSPSSRSSCPTVRPCCPRRC